MADAKGGKNNDSFRWDQTIDFAWGDQLQTACIMQERYQAKKAEIEKADDAKQIVALVS